MARPQTPYKEAIMFSEKIREKSIGKMKSMRLLTIFLLTAVMMFFTMGESALAVQELDKANVFIEWNTSDGDQGLQFFWDSEGFEVMRVFNDEGDLVLVVNPKNNVELQGLTETAIESVEPEQSEQTLDDFLERFPEGTYRFRGRSIPDENGDTERIRGDAELRHDLLEPVVFEEIDLPEIEWEEPKKDGLTGEPLEVVGYEIVVELVVEDGEEERVFKETTTLPAGIDEYEVSETFMEVIERFEKKEKILELKVEILADEPSGNRTITEEVLFEAVD
jgi:hypothetical protein